MVLPHPSSPLLRTTSAGVIVLFSFVNTKYIHHICLLHPLLMSSLHWCHPDRTCIAFLSFTLCVDSLGVHLGISPCIDYASIRLTPITHSFSVACPAPLSSSLQCIALHRLFTRSPDTEPWDTRDQLISDTWESRTSVTSS
jgi:hypothetical protein